MIDAHAHIFPEKIAAKASDAIGDFYGISMHHTGLLDELTGFGAQCGIEGFLVSSTATVPHQVPSIQQLYPYELRRQSAPGGGSVRCTRIMPIMRGSWTVWPRLACGA